MTNQDIQNLIKEFRVPPHVQKHCKAVADFVVDLAEKLASKGVKVDIPLLRSAAMIHDFVRVVDFKFWSPEKFPQTPSESDMVFWKSLREKYNGLGHEEAAAQILEERGFSDVAKLVRKHRFTQIMQGFNSLEEKLLYYADKRAKHDTVVPLKERLEDGRNRNVNPGVAQEESKKIEAKVYELEKEINDMLK